MKSAVLMFSNLCQVLAIELSRTDSVNVEEGQRQDDVLVMQSVPDSTNECSSSNRPDAPTSTEESTAVSSDGGRNSAPADIWYSTSREKNINRVESFPQEAISLPSKTPSKLPKLTFPVPRSKIRKGGGYSSTCFIESIMHIDIGKAK